MPFRVRTQNRAVADIEQIVGYIHERSPQGARSWLSALEEAKGRLAENPESCAAAHENPLLDREVKQLLFKTRHGRVYRIVFTIVGDAVQILRIRGPGQAPINPTDL